ncbi:hypothetical protein EAF40_23965, partial [Escherichia coli]|nr:hypothetical protein [Escherichia coli]
KHSENRLINHKKSPDGKFTNLWIVILLKSKTRQPRYLWEKSDEKTSYLFVIFLIRKNRYYRICIY